MCHCAFSRLWIVGNSTALIVPNCCMPQPVGFPPDIRNGRYGLAVCGVCASKTAPKATTITIHNARVDAFSVRAATLTVSTSPIPWVHCLKIQAALAYAALPPPLADLVLSYSSPWKMQWNIDHPSIAAEFDLHERPQTYQLNMDRPDMCVFKLVVRSSYSCSCSSCVARVHFQLEQ